MPQPVWREKSFWKDLPENRLYCRSLYTFQVQENDWRAYQRAERRMRGSAFLFAVHSQDTPEEYNLLQGKAAWKNSVPGQVVKQTA